MGDHTALPQGGIGLYDMPKAAWIMWDRFSKLRDGAALPTRPRTPSAGEETGEKAGENAGHRNYSSAPRSLRYVGVIAVGSRKIKRLSFEAR